MWSFLVIFLAAIFKDLFLKILLKYLCYILWRIIKKSELFVAEVYGSAAYVFTNFHWKSYVFFDSSGSLKFYL